MLNATELLKNTVILSYTFRAWGNKRKADTAKIETDSDKTRLKLQKELVKSEEYDAIISYQNEVRRWLYRRSVPSFFRDALMLVKTDMVGTITDYLKDSQTKQRELVEKFITVYPAKKAEAKIALNGMFNGKDYPAPEVIRSSFKIEKNWIALSVPETLPDSIRAIENQKLQDMWEESISEITKSLREGFKELVDHAVDRLTILPGEKPKVFRDSFVENFSEFIETFSARNVINDAELDSLVSKAKAIMSNVSSSELRNDTRLRDYTARKFAELKADVDNAVVSVGRKFDFSDDERRAA